MWVLPKQLASAFSAEPQGSTWDLNSQASVAESSLMSRGRLMPATYWCRAWKRETWLQHLFGAMCPPSMESRFAAWWTASLADSRAKTSPTQERKSELAASEVGSGRSLQESLTKFDLDLSSLRTSRPSERTGSRSSSPTLPRSGSMQSGVLSERPMLEPLTTATESSFWPTPGANEDSFRLGGDTQQSNSLYAKAVTHSHPVLRTERGGKESFTSDRTLNPLFVEWMMGWPIGWTDCGSQVTEWFQLKPLALSGNS